MCLLIGQLALNASGVGSVVLEKAARNDAGKDPTVTPSKAEAEKAAADRSESLQRPTVEARKALEEAALKAGYNPGRLGEMTDAQLREFIKNAAQTETAAPVAVETPEPKAIQNNKTAEDSELQAMESLKARLEAESQAASVGNASVSGGASSLGSSDLGQSVNGEAVKAVLEAAEAAKSAPAMEPAVEPSYYESIEAPVHESAPVEVQSAVVEPQVDTESLEIQAIQQSMERGERVSASEKDRFYRYEAENPGTSSHSGGGSLDNVGGPDGAGYRYVDNVAPDTATYAWIELRGDAGATWLNSWTSHDDGYSYTGSTSPGGRHPIGFSFPFYGTFQDSFRCATNGFIQFTTTASSLSNAALPSTTIAGPAICPYWDDQHLDRLITGGTDVVGYKNFGTYTVIEYDSIGIFSTSCTAPNNRLKYEVILFNDGRIKIQYDIIDVCNAADSSMTVGIQSNGTAGSAALQYGLGTGTQGAMVLTGILPASGRAIWFYPVVRTHDYAIGGITTPTTAAYGPNAAVNVAGRFYNMGTTTEAADVKYSFNGGGTVTETTASLTQWSSELHAFATGITTPATNGAYTLTMWSDLAGDEARANDTARVTVNVFAGGSCNSAIEITTAGPDSATWNNTGAGDNSPGVPCYATTYNDMVFKKDVLAGHTVTFWVSSLSWTYKYMNAALRWSGNCPGDSLVKCVYNQSTAGPTGYNQTFVWTNTTGATKTVYFTIGSYTSGTSYSGNFKLAWKDTDYTDDFSVTAITSPLTTAYVPSQVATVTGTAINLGQTTQSTPIKYSFNGGATVEEATASLVRFATESHSFATQITMPGTNGTYVLSVWTDLAADQDRSNDTLKMNVTVFGGASCETVMTLPAAAGPDSATYNNCGAGTNTPGVPCTANSYDDMVFKRTVDPGHTVTFWLSSLSWTSKYPDLALRWGGACPGTNLVDCIATTTVAQYNKYFTWTNATGSTQDVYFVVGHYSGTTTSYCGNFKLAWKDVVCAPVDPPYSQGFETVPFVPVLPNCMVMENADQLAPVWESYGTNPRTGTKDGSISSIAAGVNDWLFTPGINMEEGRDYFVSYWRRVGSATYPDSMEVKAGLAPTAAAMTITAMAMDSCKSTAYVQKLGGFTAPTSDVYYIGWHNVSKTSSARTYIDDINIAASDVCSTGTVTVPAAAAADSVTLIAALGGNWYGGVPRYQWYTGVGCVNGNQIPGATTSSYKTYVSGTFSCRVHVVDSLTCVACDSAYATVIDCITPVAPPMLEGFEYPAAPTLPICWTQQDVNADGRPWLSNTSTPRSGLQCAYNQYSTGTATNDWLFSRPLLLTEGTTYYCDYWYKCGIASTSYTESLEVLAGPTRTPGGMPITIDPLFTFSNVSVYTLHSNTFTVPSTGSYYIAVHAGGGINQGGVRVDDIAIYTDNDCIAPTVAVAAVTGADSARLKAVTSGGLPALIHYQWFTGPTCTAGNEIVGATTDSLWVFTSGSYACKAWSGNETLCSVCDSGYAEVIDCDIPMTVPFTEGFEFTTGTLLPTCWTKIDVNADSRTWATIASTSYPPRSGLRAAYNTYSSGTAADDWMFSRGIALTAGDTIVVDYWYRCYLSSSSYNESLELRAGTAPDVASMTIIVDTNFTFSQVTTYTLRSGWIIVPATGTYYLGWHAGYLINQGGAMIDDISVYGYGACGAPTVDVPAVATQTFVTLTCGVSGGFGGPLHYQWYTGTPCTPGNEIVGATARQYTTFASGVFSCKAWFVDPALCSGCDSALATVIPDPCLPGGVPPIYEPWANASLPTCWSQENGNGDSYSWSYGSSYYVSSPYAAYLYTSTTPANDWLFSGPVQLTADSTYRIEYWRRASSATYTQTLKLAVGTNRHSSAMTTTLLAPYSFNNTVFAQDVGQYTAPATGSYYFGLQNTTSVSGGSVYADDFRIYKVGECAPPTSVTVNAVAGADSAVLTCTVVGGYGSAIQYQWYTGALCNPVNAIVGATNATYTALVSGAYACKAYYVSPDFCALCDSGMATVVPCNVPPTLPYTEDFESLTTPNLPYCWTQQDVNNDTRKWVGSTTYPHSGTKSAYVTYSLTGVQVDDWLFSKGVSLTAGQTYVVEYWYRSYLSSTSYIERLEVKAGTAANAGAMTIPVDPLFNFMSTTYDMHSSEFVAPTTGTYYIGIHCASGDNDGGVIVDDISIYAQGPCGAPTVTVPATAGSGTVTLTAAASGGYGGSLHYQWFTGTDCIEGNRIAGATSYQYTTTVSGTFSCRAWRVDSVTCAACDSAYADVIPPGPGEICATAITITPPSVGVPTVVPGTTVGFWPNNPNTCVSGVSNDADVYYSMTIPGQPTVGCRRIAMALYSSTSDMHLAVYQGLANCGGTALLCNDDVAEFTALPGWDIASQHPSAATASYVAADLEPGTYLIRVARYTTAGACTLSVYDNGPCNEPCDAATGLTVYLNPTNPSQVWWHFTAPSQGTYKIYSTFIKNNDGNPDNGADPQWSLDTTLEVLAAGVVECVDLDGLAAGGYENYSVVHDCPIIGRCCYGDPFAPSCADNTQDQCTALNGSWNRYRRCASDPCPVTQPNPGESCADATQLGGPLPITYSGTTVGHTNDISMTSWTTPTCWQLDSWTTSDANGPDVVWGWTVPATGTYTFSICTSSYDASILIFNYTCPTAPTQADFICGNDDNSTYCTSHTTGSQVSSISLNAGQHILIDVDGYSTNSGTYTLVISQP